MTADRRRPVPVALALLALARCDTCDAAFVAPPGRPSPGAARQSRACSTMSVPRSLNSTALPNDDDPFATLPDSLVIPDRMPSFGLSKRESTRLSCMFLRD